MSVMDPVELSLKTMQAYSYMKIDRETNPKVLEAMQREIELMQAQYRRNIRQLELYQDSIEARLAQLEEEKAITDQLATGR